MKNIDLPELTQERLVNDKFISGQFKVKNWIEFFENIKVIDEKNDKKYIKYLYYIVKILTVLAYVLGAIAIISLLIYDEEEIGLYLNDIYLLGGFILLLVLTIYLLKKRIVHYLSHKDISNIYAYYILPFLYFLKNEIGNEKKIFLEFDNRNSLAEAIDTIYPNANYGIISHTPVSIKFNLSNDIRISMRFNSIIKIRRKDKHKKKSTITTYKTKGKLVHDLQIAIPKHKLKDNAPLTAYKIVDNIAYFRFKQTSIIEPNTYNHVYELLRAWAKQNFDIGLFQVVKSIDKLYYYIKE